MEQKKKGKIGEKQISPALQAVLFEAEGRYLGVLKGILKGRKGRFGALGGMKVRKRKI